MRNLFYLLLAIFIIVPGCTKYETNAISNNKLEDESRQIECNELDDYSFNFDNEEYILKRYGELHNILLEGVRKANISIDKSNYKTAYDEIYNSFSSTIKNLEPSDSKYISIESFPSYEAMLKMIDKASGFTSFDNFNLGSLIDSALVAINEIDPRLLNSQGKLLLTNFFNDYEEYGTNFSFLDYYQSAQLITDQSSRLICLVIISITNSSTCYWNDYLSQYNSDNIQLRFWPIIGAVVLAVATADAIGAIEGCIGWGIQQAIHKNWNADPDDMLESAAISAGVASVFGGFGL